MSPVLDASVFVASISPAERHHGQARALFDSHPEHEPYVVPAVFRVEVVAALCRRGESRDVLDVVDALVRGPRFHACPVDEAMIEAATGVARRASLRAYDALYVALALARGAPLFTLDHELRDRVAVVFPDLELGPPRV